MRTQILKYFWVLTLLFVAGAAVLAAQLASVVIAERLWIEEVATAAAVSQRNERVATEKLIDYNVIAKRNVFNANPKPRKPPRPIKPDEPKKPTPPPPPTPLNITLTGTVVVEGGRSFATIEAKSERKLVRESDEVAPGAVLKTVRADRILVARGEAIQEVLLDDPEKRKSRSRSPPPARRAPTARRKPVPDDEDSDAETIRQVADDKWLIDRGEIDAASTNMNKLMTQIRVVPNMVDGQADGFRVSAIRPGSLFTKIGLRNGDVLKRINGIELQGPEQAFEAYQRLKDETSIQIDLSRRNENKTFSYEIR
jgi:general secretion pathway protein C